jgi:hypothetical protein
VLETTADNGIINYTSTHANAFANNISNCADADGDGIKNNEDIDDDNDGILDAVESPSCFLTGLELEKPTDVTSELAPYAPYSIDKSIDADPTSSASFMPNLNWVGKALFNFTAARNIAISGMSFDLVNWPISNGAANTFKLQGSTDNSTWTDLSPAVASIDNKGTFTISNTLATTSKFKYFKIVGVAGVSYYGGVYTARFVFPATFESSFYPKTTTCTVDSDNDGKLNHLDLDSDGDGCADAIEAGSSTSTTSTSVYPTGIDANSNGLLNNYEGTTAGTVKYTSTYAIYALNNIINGCTNTDGDGVPDVFDLDDDNDGVLDVVECTPFDINNLNYTPLNYTVSNGQSSSQTFPAAPDGLVVNVWNLDNSFNIKINGKHLVTPQELEFYSPATTNSVFEFLDGTDFGAVWTINGSQSKPLIRVYIDKFGAIKVFGSKTSNGNLEEMRLRTGAFNTITLNTTTINTFEIGQLVIGQTYITGDYGVINSNCDFDGDGIPNDQDLDSDGDGCADAIEAGSSTTATSTTVYPTGTDDNSNGLLNNYEGTTAGTVNYFSNYKTNALSASLNACTDTDTDGVTDLIDIDDDNDGILDAVESPTCFYTN